MHGRGFVFQQRADHLGRTLAALEHSPAGQIERRVLRVVVGFFQARNGTLNRKRRPVSERYNETILQSSQKQLI